MFNCLDNFPRSELCVLYKILKSGGLFQRPVIPQLTRYQNIKSLYIRSRNRLIFSAPPARGHGHIDNPA